MFEVKVIFDNKITEVYENEKLIHRGKGSRSRAFGLNVIDQKTHNPDCVHAQEWKEVKWSKLGHKEICHLTA